MFTILIVDDEEHFLEIVRKTVQWRQLGITKIMEARDGLTAFDIIKKERPDIILTDMKMPYSDGVELLKKCSELELKSEIIIISGYDDFKYTRQAIKSGILDYLLKPVNPEELNSILERAVHIIKNKKTADVRPEMDRTNYAQAVKIYIEENYAKQISLDYISQMFYLSKEGILKKFKAAYGIGIYEYVMQLRMEKARHLLTYYNYQIKEVSDKVGFNDSNYFSKAFKKHFGYSPKNIKGIPEDD